VISLDGHMAVWLLMHAKDALMSLEIKKKKQVIGIVSVLIQSTHIYLIEHYWLTLITDDKRLTHYITI